MINDLMMCLCRYRRVFVYVGAYVRCVCVRACVSICFGGDSMLAKLIITMGIIQINNLSDLLFEFVSTASNRVEQPMRCGSMRFNICSKCESV